MQQYTTVINIHVKETGWLDNYAKGLGPVQGSSHSLLSVPTSALLLRQLVGFQHGSLDMGNKGILHRWLIHMAFMV